MTDKDRLGKARERGHLTASNGRWGERAHNQWYAECKIEGRAFVTIAPRVRYATVKLDMWSCDRLLSGDEIAAAKALLLPYLARYTSILTGRSFALCESIPIERAEQVARSLLEIVDTDDNCS